MKDQKRDSSPGKSHIIRLYEKDVTVKVHYSSPRNEPCPQVEDSPAAGQQIVIESVNYMTSNHLNMKKHKKKSVLKPRHNLGEFYLYHMKDSNNLAQQYEQFQQNMIDKVPIRRLKVYSNSKTQSHYQTPSKHLPVPLKLISLKSYKPKSIQASGHAKVDKPESTVKKESAIAPRSITKICKIRLFQKSSEKKNKQNSMSKSKRKHKIEVVSGKRRRKNDSLDSGVGQLSLEMQKGRLNTSTERCSNAAVNSFNISVFY